MELIKEDKNLNGAYISISQYIWLLEQENKQLKEENAKLKLKPLQGIFAQVDDDMLLRNCGAMQQEVDNYKSIFRIKRMVKRNKNK